MHHVINRGNYRRDLFENVAAAEAFLRTLHEAAGKFGWKLHAYVRAEPKGSGRVLSDFGTESGSAL
jgi:hypothetical protein